MVNKTLMKIEYNYNKKITIKDSHKELLELFLKGQPINYEDVKKIWIDYYAIKIIDGEPYRWISEWEKQMKHPIISVGNFIKMDELEIRRSVFSWMKSCIGSLVFKGYLKVIPNFNFEIDNY